MNTRPIAVVLIAITALIPLAVMASGPLEAEPLQSASPPGIAPIPGRTFSPNTIPALQGSSVYTPFIPLVLRPPTYVISGQVTFQSNPLADVTITVRAGVTTTTNVSGTYAIRLFEGTHTLTPSKPNYVFTPPSRTIALHSDTPGQNFTATLPTYTVSGRATDGANPVAGVVISAGVNLSATTDSSGNYTLGNLTAGTYVLTATKLGLAFPSRTVTVPPDRTGIDFARLIAQVTFPNGMVSDASQNHLFVSSRQDSSTVAVFTETVGMLSPRTTIPIYQRQASGVGLLDNKVYVANWGNPDPSTVSVIDTRTLTKDKDISIKNCGGDAVHLAVNPATRHVFVTLHAGNQVAMIDTTNADSVSCIATNAAPFGVAVHTASNSVFVGNRDGLDLWRIADTPPFTATQVVDWRTPASTGSPFHISVSPATNRLFAMVGLENPDIPDKLYVYDIGTSGELTPVIGTPIVVCNTGDGGYVRQSHSACSVSPNLIYIAANAIDEVWVLNGDLTLRKRLTSANGIGKKPLALAENTVLKQVYIANTQSNSISVWDACDAAPAQ